MVTLRDEHCASVRCVTSRGARHVRGMLTAKAAGRVWCGGGSRDGARDVRGRVSSYATSNGGLLVLHRLNLSPQLRPVPALLAPLCPAKPQLCACDRTPCNSRHVPPA